VQRNQKLNTQNNPFGSQRQRDREFRSARLQRTEPKGLFHYRSAALRAFSSTSFITQRDVSCRCNPLTVADSSRWSTTGASNRGSQVGSHRRLTPGHTEPTRTFGFSALPATQTRLDTSADTTDLVRIEVVLRGPHHHRLRHQTPTRLLCQITPTSPLRAKRWSPWKAHRRLPLPTEVGVRSWLMRSAEPALAPCPSSP
jgi:hypothetical protein